MTWEFDAVTWTAIGTWFLVVGTLALMYWQTRQNRQLNSATQVMALRERFDSGQLRSARKQLATHLLNNEHEDITNLEVGAFFELVGTLTHRNVLDEDLVWEAFGGWVTNYYYALRHPVDLIGRARENMKDPWVLHEFEWLNDRIVGIDRAKMGAVQAAELEKEEESRFILKREANLDLP